MQQACTKKVVHTGFYLTFTFKNVPKNPMYINKEQHCAENILQAFICTNLFLRRIPVASTVLPCSEMWNSSLGFYASPSSDSALVFSQDIFPWSMFSSLHRDPEAQDTLQIVCAVSCTLPEHQ